MADVQDVMDALAELCVGALFDGDSSVTGDSLLVYPGWPSATQLEQALDSGHAHVTVFPSDSERNTTRYSPYEEEELSIPEPTISGQVSGSDSFTLSGTAEPAQNVAVVLTWLGGVSSFVHRVSESDTLGSIASSLAASITAGGLPASASGATVTLTGATEITLRVGVVGKIQTEVRRQERLMQVMLWASSVEQRSRIGRILDKAIAEVQFLNLSDGSGARLIYHGSPFIDRFQKENCFRRDWRLTTEYGTTVTTEAPSIVIPEFNWTGSVAC